MRVTFSSCCGHLTRKGFILADFEDLKRNDAAFLRLARRYGGRWENDVTPSENCIYDRPNSYTKIGTSNNRPSIPRGARASDPHLPNPNPELFWRCQSKNVTKNDAGKELADRVVRPLMLQLQKVTVRGTKLRDLWIDSVPQCSKNPCHRCNASY